MRSILLTTGLLLLVGWLGWGCQSGSTTIGQDIISPNQLDIQYIDTVSVFTSTVAAPDTFLTASDQFLLVGHWRDALAGGTNAAGFGTATFAGNSLADLTDIVYDSLVLEMPYSYVYGDTTQPFTVQAYRLTTSLLDKAYYNNNSAAYEKTPFAQRTFYPRPRSGREAGLVRIRLSDELGQQFYTKLRNRTLETFDQFKAIFPGIALTGTSAANLFVGFSVATSRMALYFHQTSASTTQLVFPFTLSGNHFNRVQNDFSGTPLQTLHTRADRVPSAATNHTTFLTNGPALRTRIDIPALAQLALSTNYAGVNGAQLVVQPVFRTQLDYFTVGLPKGPPAGSSALNPGGLGTLALYETNENNDIVGGGTGPIGSTTPASAGYALSPYGSAEYSLALQDSYTFDLSQYVLQVLRRDRQYRPLLMVLSPPAGSGTTTVLNRLTIGDRFNTTDPIRLRLLLTYTK